MKNIINSFLIPFLLKIKLLQWSMYDYKIIGRNIGYGHPSVKHGLHHLRVLNHIIHGRISVHRSRESISRTLSIKVGPGAGYVSGITAYLGILCKDVRRSRNANIYVRRFIQTGITRNANIVPYAS